MLQLLNSIANVAAPELRQWAKPMFKKWCQSRVAFLTPVRKKIAGMKFWCHPRFISDDLSAIEPPVSQWLRRNLKPGHRFFDIGANFGFHVLPAARLVGRQGRVIAFEPSPANRSVLKYHRLMNGLTQIEIDPRPVSNQCGQNVPFYLLDGGDQSSNSLTIGGEDVPYMDGIDRKPIFIETVALDEFCLDCNIHPQVMKIDVEGAELMVLRGATNVLRNARPSVILAVHPFWLPPGQSPHQIVELLSSLGYLITDSDGKTVEELAFAEYLCTPENARQ
jgi:FkbM family methyltransferase